jgi:hypothetical protein
MSTFCWVQMHDWELSYTGLAFGVVTAHESIAHCCSTGATCTTWLGQEQKGAPPFAQSPGPKLRMVVDAFGVLAPRMVTAAVRWNYECPGSCNNHGVVQPWTATVSLRRKTVQHGAVHRVVRVNNAVRVGNGKCAPTWNSGPFSA